MNRFTIPLMISFVLLGGLISYLYVTRSQQIKTPILPASQPLESISPTQIPESLSISGEISEIVGSVGYKSALLIKVDTTPVYITLETVITDSNGNSISSSNLKTSDSVNIVGLPAEGGIEAHTISVENQTATSSSIPTSN